MEIDKIKNFLMMFPYFSLPNNFAIIGLEQMAEDNETYRITSIPSTTDIVNYICGGGVRRINFAFQYKGNISNVKEGGNINVAYVYDLYGKIDKWLTNIIKTTTYQNYYEQNKNEYVANNLDYTNWVRLKLIGQPNLIDFPESQDIGIFTCMCQLDYEI